MSFNMFLILTETSSQNTMHLISQGLLIPTIVILNLLVAVTVIEVGIYIAEAVGERHRLKRALPALFKAVQESTISDMPSVIAESGILSRQKIMLQDVIDHRGLPTEALAARAKESLAAERDRYVKRTNRTELISKIAPMLGLMGTLIPLGPGIVAMSSGDTATLANSMLIAFDTTVVGLVSAVVCLVLTKYRKRWYNLYLSTLESTMVTILEFVDKDSGEGGRFPNDIDDSYGAEGSEKSEYSTSSETDKTAVIATSAFNKTEAER